MEIFNSFEIEGIYLSEITKVEFNSVVWKKVRIKEIKQDKAKKLTSIFQNDYKKFMFIDDTKEIKEKARDLIEKYGKMGLRTLDAIQLATAISIKHITEFSKTHDKLLLRMFKLERLVKK